MAFFRKYRARIYRIYRVAGISADFLLPARLKHKPNYTECSVETVTVIPILDSGRELTLIVRKENFIKILFSIHLIRFDHFLRI